MSNESKGRDKGRDAPTGRDRPEDREETAGRDETAGADGSAAAEEQDAVELPINGELDLHLFRPKEVKSLVPDYLEECRKRGIYQVRVIHGKGKGVLLQTVHAVLRKLEMVETFALDTGPHGGWGATKVQLRQEAPSADAGR